MTFDPPHLLRGLMCDSTQGSLCPSPMGIHQCMWIQGSILQMTNQRSLTPRWPLTPHLLRSYVWLYSRIIVSKSHENTSKYVDTVTFFWKKLELKVIDPKMTFDPTSVEVTCVTLPKDHCVQVPWKYIKVCGYSDPFCKTWSKDHWPLDDLWPHICWGHICDSTQGSLCPSPMGIIHQCMWIQWSILQIYHKHTTYYIHTLYILRPESVIT